MSKHNYTQYSNAKKYDNKSNDEEMVEHDNPIKHADFVEEVDAVKMVEETVKTVPIPKVLSLTALSSIFVKILVFMQKSLGLLMLTPR